MQTFDLATAVGLSDDEAADRLTRDGYNELPSSKPRSLFAIALEVVREPMFLLLVASGSLYLVLGDLTEGLLLLAFVFVVMGITLYQQRKTERALEALRDLSSPRALVIRDGGRKRIPGREVVRGDLVMLAEGDRVPADAVLLDSTGLTVDESLLTGESVPVRKRATSARAGDLRESERRGQGPPKRACLAEAPKARRPCVFSGTLVVQGQGVACVQATGVGTELGKIGRALQTLEPEDTAIQRETGRLVRGLAIFGATLCALVVVVYGLTRGDWLHGLLAGLTLAMAMLPEEFPVVLTIFLALGAWRLSQRQVLTRRVAAIETLGAATVLCVDKTGTLTLNQMTVRRILGGRPGRTRYAPIGRTCPSRSTRRWSSRFSPASAIRSTRWRRRSGSWASATSRRASTCTTTGRWCASTRSRTELLAMSHVWKSRETEDYVIAAKGAPEAIADLCHLDDRQRAERCRPTWRRWRPTACGCSASRAPRSVPRRCPANSTTSRSSSSASSASTTRCGPRAVEAVRECDAAGIRVVMITGDYPGTALNIGRQVGLRTRDGRHRRRARRDDATPSCAHA